MELLYSDEFEIDIYNATVCIVGPIAVWQNVLW